MITSNTNSEILRLEVSKFKLPLNLRATKTSWFLLDFPLGYFLSSIDLLVL